MFGFNVELWSYYAVNLVASSSAETESGVLIRLESVDKAFRALFFETEGPFSL